MFSRLFGQVNEDVWFSRDIQQGQLLHWMVTVKPIKVVLRRRMDGFYDLMIQEASEWTPEAENRAVAATGRISIYPYDRYVLTRIGYTPLRERDITKHLQALRSHYPAQLTWAQCQDFLQRYVTRMVDKPEMDWHWFLDNTNTSCQNVLQLPLIPARLLAAYEAQQRQPQQQQNDSALWAGRMAMQVGVANQISQQQQLLNNMQTINQWYGGNGS